MSLEAKDLRGNEPDELRSAARKLQEDLFKHRLKKTTSQLENTMLIRQTRRDIARVYTVLAERVRQLGTGGGKAAANETVAESAQPAPKEPTKATAKAAVHETTKASGKATAAKATQKKPAGKSAAKPKKES
jgi:large subunit ribosomal protein L29